jgi:5'-nucleotidase
MKNILIANDDGIDSSGIKALAEALSEDNNIFVCAPNGQRSASSHSITIVKDVFVTECEFENAKYAFSFSGMPADCV